MATESTCRYHVFSIYGIYIQDLFQDNSFQANVSLLNLNQLLNIIVLPITCGGQKIYICKIAIEQEVEHIHNLEAS